MKFETFLKKNSLKCHCISTYGTYKTIELEELGEWALKEIKKFMKKMDYNEWEDFDGEEMCAYFHFKEIAEGCIGKEKVNKVLKEGDLNERL